MILEGEKVILRPVDSDDAHRFFQWLSDEEINKSVLRRTISEQDAKAWTQQFEQSAKEGSVSGGRDKIHFAIDTKEHIHIGCISLKINRQDSNAELALLIGEKEYWKRGCGQEASRLMIRYAFDELKMHRVWLSVYEYNTRAFALYRKLGFKEEGILREHVLYQGIYYDEIFFGMLREEWKKTIG